MSYEEAQERAAEENKSFSKTEFFRMEKLGTYNLRILPLAPERNGTLNRKGYEIPTRNFLLELQKPSGSDSKPIYVSVPRTIDAGFTTDLIDTYRKLATDEAYSRGNEKMAEKIAGGSFGGGLKYNYSHSAYVIDLKDRAKGIQLLSLSHSQFKSLDEIRMNLWQKLTRNNPAHPCPIASHTDSYAVEITKKKTGSKTEYSVSVDVLGGANTLTSEELTQLINAPRIPEVVYRYSRYHYEATIEYLKQCDKRYEMEIMETSEMIEAIEQLGSELSKEDKTSFTFDKRSKAAQQSGATIILDDLFTRFEELQKAGIDDKTEEGQTLREMIRVFIEQEKLDMRMTRNTTNKDLLEMTEAAYSAAPEPSAEGETEVTEEQPATRPRRR